MSDACKDAHGAGLLWGLLRRFNCIFAQFKKMTERIQFIHNVCMMWLFFKNPTLQIHKLEQAQENNEYNNNSQKINNTILKNVTLSMYMHIFMNRNVL